MRRTKTDSRDCDEPGSDSASVASGVRPEATAARSIEGTVDVGPAARGQSNVVAIVLLLGMVLLGASLTAYVGAGVLSDLQTSVYEQDAEQTIREVDSRLTEVALGDNLQHTLAFDASEDQTVRVKDDAEMEIRLGSCDTFEIPMGSIHYENEDGSTVTYQGGGIWRTNPSGNNSMVSPPDMEYRDGTVTFPAVNVNGSIDGRVETLQASKDLERSRERTENYTTKMEDCVDASNMTVTVTSRYADAWGSYLEGRVSENVTYDLDTPDVDNNSVTAWIELAKNGGMNATNNGTTTRADSTVRVDILGTEVSREGCLIFSCDKEWIPVTMGILEDGEEIRPWPNGSQDASAITAEHNLNTPETQEKVWTHEFEADEGTTISLRATRWKCTHDEWEDAGSDFYDGRVWEHRNCDDLDNEDPDNDGVTIDASKGENPNNVRVLGDGDEMPVLETQNRQRNAEEILGSRVNETGHLQLESNQVVFLFELTAEGATWDDADTGIGDPNYNDAIALLEIEDQVGKETSGNGFQVRLAMNEVVIEPKNG